MTLIALSNSHHSLHLQVRSTESPASTIDACYKTIKSSSLIFQGSSVHDRFRVQRAKVRHPNAHGDLLTKFMWQKIKSINALLDPGKARPSGPIYEALHVELALDGPSKTISSDQMFKQFLIVILGLQYLAKDECCENSSIAHPSLFISLLQLPGELIRSICRSIRCIGDTPHRPCSRTSHDHSKPVRHISPIRRQRAHRHLEFSSLKVERILP